MVRTLVLKQRRRWLWQVLARTEGERMEHLRYMLGGYRRARRMVERIARWL